MPFQLGNNVKAVRGDRPAAYTATDAFTMITDLFIMALLIQVVWKLQMRTSSQTGVRLILRVGLLEVKKTVPLSISKDHLSDPRPTNAILSC